LTNTPQYKPSVSKDNRIAFRRLELSVKRQRAILTALIERVDAGNDRIDIHIRPSRLGAIFDVLPLCRAPVTTNV